MSILLKFDIFEIEIYSSSEYKTEHNY